MNNKRFSIMYNTFTMDGEKTCRKARIFARYDGREAAEQMVARMERVDGKASMEKFYAENTNPYINRKYGCYTEYYIVEKK